MKTIAWLAAVGTMLMGLVYMVVSLNRWEWNRALFFGLIVLIAEVGIAAALILRRLTRIEQAKLDPAILAILRETRPASPHRFGWLEDSTTQMNVFITFLVGGGVLLSALAWVADKVGAKTYTPAGEEKLARQLGSISYPRGGLMVDEVTALAQEVPGTDDRQIRKLLSYTRPQL
jgi:hypothetical protein